MVRSPGGQTVACAVLAVSAVAGVAVVATPLRAERVEAVTVPAPAPAPVSASPAAAVPRKVVAPTKVKAVPKSPTVVALGDSVPAGLRCECTTFVQAYGAAIAAARGAGATVHNEAVPGATSADVLEQLDSDDVESEVRAATTVLIMVGANDFVDSFQTVSEGGVTAANGYSAVANTVQANVTAIVKRVRALSEGPVHIVVLDYWNTKADGAVARESYSAGQNFAAAWATWYANRALRLAALATRAWYVSTFAAFKGSHGRQDPTRLLGDDGDHPNAAGHRLIAGALTAVLPAG
jgi:acyl-CoA thioesterase-1